MKFLSKVRRKLLGWTGRVTPAEEERMERMVGPPGVWKESRDFQIQFLRSRGLESTNSVLDIGCGPLRGGIPLIKYLDSGCYAGIDIREDSIREAEAQIGRHRLGKKNPVVCQSDTFGADELAGREFDYVWCFQVLYHLDDELADSCLREISRLIGAEGVCYTNVNTLIEEGIWQEFPFVRRSIEFYQDLGRKHGVSVKVLGQQLDWGYTQKVPGHTNHMLEIRRNHS